ncbi:MULTISPECIES: ester cyclase [Caulobacter]|nr:MULTISPECIES: ester cyclase [Caulobacter]MBQ1562827.1 ester cyclase [Caulobacter sp.]
MNFVLLALAAGSVGSGAAPPRANWVATCIASCSQENLRGKTPMGTMMTAADPAFAPSDEAVVRAFIDQAWNKGDYRHLPSQLAPVVTLHFHGKDIPLRVEDMIGFVERFRNAFADFNWQVDEAVSQGGTVAMRTTFSGTMTGSFDGHPPNGKQMRVSFQLFAHVRDGRIQELWEEYDVAGMRRQLGLEP